MKESGKEEKEEEETAVYLLQIVEDPGFQTKGSVFSPGDKEKPCAWSARKWPFRKNNLKIEQGQKVVGGYGLMQCTEVGLTGLGICGPALLPDSCETTGDVCQLL